MKYCHNCGRDLADDVMVCPYCATQQRGPTPIDLKSQTLTVMLAVLGGAFGFHRFYLRKYISGVFYLLFFWTAIPSLISLVEMILIAFMSPSEWAKKYNQNFLGTPVPGFVKVIVLLPTILFALAFTLGMGSGVFLPAYEDYKTRAQTSGALAALSACKEAQVNEFRNTGQFLVGDIYEICSIASLPSGVDGFNIAATSSKVELMAFFEDGQELSLIGEASDENEIKWTCISATMEKREIPQNCTIDPLWESAANSPQTMH